MANHERQLAEQPRQPEGVTLGNLSIGIYKPEKFITNEEIETWKIKKPSKELLTASGIHEKIAIDRRFIAAPHESAIEMGIHAAIATENLKDIDAVLTSSSYPLGVNISKEIAARLKIEPKFHLDIHAACSGFVRGLTYMKEHEEKFQGKRVLFVATEKYSHTLTDLRVEGATENDPSMSQLIFSDGAVACVFEFGKDIQVLKYENIKLPEAFNKYLRMPIDKTLMVMPYIEEPIPTSLSPFLEQDGPHVFQRILSYVPALNKKVVETGFQPSDIKLAIPHQASGPMIDGLAKKMPEYTLFNDLQDGNFSSASIPKAWARAILEERIQSGDTILLSGFGAGLFASSAVVKIN